MQAVAFSANRQVSLGAARRALAATFRLAVRFDLHESIDNHFSLAVDDEAFLINPYGIHWSRLRASDLLVVDGAGRVLEGDGEVEGTALHIHAAIHRRHPNAACVLHTHMPYATAIACTEGGRLLPVSQTAAIFAGRIAYDDHYGGLGDNPDEGDRLAAAMGDKPVLFMANHGVITAGRDPAEAFNTLYYLERAARLQVLAASTGRPLKHLSPEITALRPSFDGRGAATVHIDHPSGSSLVDDRGDRRPAGNAPCPQPRLEVAGGPAPAAIWQVAACANFGSHLPP